MAGKARIQIDYDKVYQSNSCGPFKIIDNLGRDNRSRLYVRIKFLDTGTELDVRYDLAMDGRVLDDLYGIDFDTIYDSMYYGQFKIISYQGRNKESKKIVRIKFLNTGFETDALLKYAKLGQVKDYSVKQEDRTFNISSKEKHDEFIVKILQGRWHAMMDRCYNPNCPGYEDYGGSGVTVCKYWHKFENYLESMPYIQNYDKFYQQPHIYQLDKDFYQYDIPTNKRVYSPDTCVFLSTYDNSNLSVFENKYQEYHGVRQAESGNYYVEFSIDGKKYRFGTYSDLIAALNEYNYYYQQYSKAEFIQLLNRNIPYMDHETAQQYLIGS